MEVTLFSNRPKDKNEYTIKELKAKKRLRRSLVLQDAA